MRKNITFLIAALFIIGVNYVLELQACNNPPPGSVWCSHYNYEKEYTGKKSELSDKEDHTCRIWTPGGSWDHSGKCQHQNCSDC